MSEQNFDNKIRQKLESIRPEFEKAAWEKLRKSLPVPWYVALFRDFGQWIYGGVATTALLTTYYFYHNLKQENELLNDKISTLSVQTPEVKTDTVYLQSQKTDTVWVTKVITQKVYVDRPQRGPSAYNTDENVALNENEEQTTTGNENTTDAIRSNTFRKGVGSQKVGVKTEDESKVVFSKKSKANISDKASTSEVKGNKAENTGLNTTSKAETYSKSTPEGAKNEDPISNYVSDAQPKNESANSYTKSELPKTTYEDNEVNNAKETAKAETPKVAELVVPERVFPEQEPKKESSFLKKINARFGMSAEMAGNRGVNLGPTLEVFLNDKFSINSGVLISKGRQMQFGLPKDFNNKTGNRFEDRYVKLFNPVGPPPKIKNIEIETSIIKLPLYFNFYVPLRNKLTFLVTTGTKFDLSVIEGVKYQTETAGETYFAKFENSYKPKFFNSLFYGMGLQYQQGRFYGQVNPYFEFPFRSTNSLLNNKRVGVNFSLKYGLKK
jgi:hypothetical protein